MKKIFALILTMILLFTGCGEVSNNSSKNCKTIVIGVEDYPPAAFRNEQGEFIGFEIDLAKETAKRMGVAVEFKIIDWNKKKEALYSENIDMIWNGLDILPEREEYMLFSKPYMDNRQILLLRHGEYFDIHSEYDLAGKSVGVQAGSTAAIYVEEDNEFKESFSELTVYPTLKDALDALEDGQIDVMICDELTGRYEMIKRDNKFDVLGMTIGSVSKIGIGFRKDNAELRDRVQRAFDEIIRDGTAKKISERWFNVDVINSRT